MFAAMTPPQLACQDFDGRFAGPSPSRSGHHRLHDGVLTVGDVDVLRVMAARDTGDPAVRDVVQMIEYRQPVFFS